MNKRYRILTHILEDDQFDPMPDLTSDMPMDDMSMDGDMDLPDEGPEDSGTRLKVELTQHQIAVLALIVSEENQPIKAREMINSLPNASHACNELVSLGLVENDRTYYKLTSAGRDVAQQSGLISTDASEPGVTEDGRSAILKVFFV